jgi:hypothetical protein
MRPRLCPLVLSLPLCLSLACNDANDGKAAAPAFDLAKECDRLGTLAEAEGIIAPDRIPAHVETCKTDMAKLEQASASAYAEQSKCLTKAKDYVAAQSCVEQATMKLLQFGK